MDFVSTKIVTQENNFQFRRLLEAFYCSVKSNVLNRYKEFSDLYVLTIRQNLRVFS